MNKIEVEAWCKKNGFVLIDMRVDDKNIILIRNVIEIAEAVSRLNKGETNLRTRKKEVVFARWLVWAYLKEMTELSLANMGWMLARMDHATVLYGIKTLSNERFTGWRKEYKDKFESKMNQVHKKLELKELYI